MAYDIVTYEDGSVAPIHALALEGQKESPYGPYQFTNLETLQKLCTIFVMTDGERPVGFLAAFINDQGPILKGTKVATELFWYVSPMHRSTRDSTKLIEAYEQWARDHECKLASMSNMRNQYMDRLGKLYERMGYHKAEETYLKELT